jgi:hypothetical protein
MGDVPFGWIMLAWDRERIGGIGRGQGGVRMVLISPLYPIYSLNIS